ncbi:LysM peptidoglycan-binding domain-containing protein, partial [Myxococcota bacterium]|nr:LysM peptidoglycan-binding domain-containing protein [Myxococcota bacterium]
MPRSLLRRSAPLLITFAVVAAAPAARAQEGEVSVSLPAYRALIAELAALRRVPPPPIGHAIAERSLELAFQRGVLSGTLSVVVDVFSADAPAIVPLVDAESSLSSVSVDGARAVALRSDEHYAVVIDAPGRHAIRVSFARGREETRFSRAFSLPLPPAPVTRFSLSLPEKGLDVDVAGGVVFDARPSERGTRVEGALDSRGALSVRWQPRLGQVRTAARSLEVESLALATIAEEVVRTKTALRYRVTSGETDRLELAVPEAVEVVHVGGDAVLQWFTEPAPAAGASKKLVVLLRHLVDGDVSCVVTAELPKVRVDAASLAFLTPIDATLREGWVAVEGREGFEVRPARADGASEVGTREVPSALSALSDKPLLFAYRYGAGVPVIELAIARNAELELTQALVDDLQASTVLVEQGAEITKLRLYVRNNTRQYLAMTLPAGASLTHALIDGVPFHPAVEHGPDGVERLLVPLRQSEKLSDAKPRHHTVRPGETLGEVALLYYNRAERWSELMAANPELGGTTDLHVGQRLVIPARAGGVALEESNFVVELAYKVDGPALSLASRHRVALPALDLPVMAVTWHYYFPEDFEPLSFETNLRQLTHVRYDPLRRLIHFLERATELRGAWAGGFHLERDAYSNILESRKAIYHREQRREVTEALSSFPLVGERYRFGRVLLGEEQAFLELVYVKRSVLPIVQVAALLAILLLAVRVVRSVRADGLARALRREPAWTFAATMFVLLFVGHHVLGVHRSIVLGLDLALVVVLWPRLAQLRRALGAASD